MLFINPPLINQTFLVPKEYEYNDGSMLDSKLENVSNKSRIFYNEISSDVVIVNCAAERRSDQDVKTRAGNYDFQLNVLDRLLSEGKSVQWIQLESYWQNSLEVTPSPRYVYWKNELRSMLIEKSKNHNLKVISIVLPHVIGVNDNKNRYLNKVFESITFGRKVTLKNSENLFYLCDIDDICKYLIKLILQPEVSTKVSSSLFPFHTVKLSDLINQFKNLAKSNSNINFEIDESGKNPLMCIECQPVFVSSKEISLTNLDMSLSKILGWIKK
jgi:hypothetical protein